MKAGIEIRMHPLNKVEIVENGQKAKIGGGAKAGNITQALWARGKQAG